MHVQPLFSQNSKKFAAPKSLCEQTLDILWVFNRVTQLGLLVIGRGEKRGQMGSRNTEISVVGEQYWCKWGTMVLVWNSYLGDKDTAYKTRGRICSKAYTACSRASFLHYKGAPKNIANWPGAQEFKITEISPFI